MRRYCCITGEWPGNSWTVMGPAMVRDGAREEKTPAPLRRLASCLAARVLLLLWRRHRRRLPGHERVFREDVRDRGVDRRFAVLLHLLGDHVRDGALEHH